MVAAKEIEEKACLSYSDCSLLNAMCSFIGISFSPFAITFQCRCTGSFEHITGLTEYTAADGNQYTSKCDHESGTSENFSFFVLTF